MTTEDSISIEFNLNEDIVEANQRRLSLLNDASYGVILSFLDKYRSVLDLPNYSLQRLEDHLMQCEKRSNHFSL